MRSPGNSWTSGEMPVGGLPEVVGGHPLLQPAGLRAHPRQMEPPLEIGDGPRVRGVPAQHLARRAVVGEQGPDQLLCVRDALGVERAVLGRPVAVGDEDVPLLAGDGVGDRRREQPGLPELAGSLEHRVDTGEMGAVLGELVVLVQGVAQPGVACRVPPPAHAAVDVGGDGDGPTGQLAGGVAVAVAGVVEVGAGEFGPGGQLGQAVVGEGVEAVGEGGTVGHPVVHLEVDVGVVIPHPVRVVAVEPQPLEVQRQTATRPGDHEVAPEL